MQTFTGLEYAQIDVANQFGLDKENWDTRLQWVQKHDHELECLIDKAETIPLYIKAVKTLRQAQEGIPTGAIMGLDATSSGLQIMACLSGCEATARNTNLIDTGKRENIYSKAQKYMHKLGVNVEYKELKKCTMTVFYGSTLKPKLLFGEDTFELQMYYQMLSKELPGGMDCLEAIQSCWDPEALEYSWHLPDGHTAKVKVTEKVDKRIEIDELNHVTFTYRAEVNQCQDFGLALAANIVHSVDGYIAREMVRRAYYADFDLLTIHDSFWASPNHMNFVRETYLNLLIELARSDLLNSILLEITNKRTGYIKLATDLPDKMLGAEYALS